MKYVLLFEFDEEIESNDELGVIDNMSPVLYGQSKCCDTQETRPKKASCFSREWNFKKKKSHSSTNR